MAVHYAVFPRTEPGGGPDPWTPTPCQVALVYRSRLDCLAALPARPVLREVLGVTTMLVLTEIDRTPVGVNADGGQEFIDRARSSFAKYGAPAGVTALATLLKMHRNRFELNRGEFGDTVNLDALRAMDLTDAPDICEGFRQAYIAILEREEPFDNPFWTLFENHQWVPERVQPILDAFDDPTSIVHQMERWHSHAWAVVTIPKLERHLS